MIKCEICDTDVQSLTGNSIDALLCLVFHKVIKHGVEVNE